MAKCIDSLLVGGEDVEIIIVDDGSKDRTAEIAARSIPESRMRRACFSRWLTVTTDSSRARI